MSERDRIIAVGAHKGGPGKTTISHILATGLANEGCRVALVDLDAQAQICDWLGMDQAPGLWRCLVDNRPAAEQLVEVPPERWRVELGADGALFILPADRSNEAVWSHVDDELLLRRKLLALLDQGFDYVVLDTPPAISTDAVSYLLAAGRIVIPTKVSYLSVKGVLATLETIRRLRERTRGMAGGGVDVDVIGILPNMFRINRSVHRQNLAALRAQFGDAVWPEINDYVAFEEAPQAHLAIWVYDPGSDTAGRARARAARVMETFKKRIGVNER